jgi:thiamine-phosphate pyrophosphorylase
MTRSRPQDTNAGPPRLYVVTPPVHRTDVAGALAAALEAADVAAVLLRLHPDSEGAMVKTVKALAPVVQDRGAALLLDGYPQLVGRTGADGAHLTGAEAFRDAVDTLKPDRIAGAGGLLTRHDAMLAAEAGADYVMFGEPNVHGHHQSFELTLGRIGWWAEVFQTPCVGFASNTDEVEALSKAGADFVAVGSLVFDDTRGPAAAVASIGPYLLAREAIG